MDQVEKEVAELDQIMSQPDFWDDQNKAKSITRDASNLQRRLENWNALDSALSDIEVLAELAIEEGDESTLSEVADELSAMVRQVEQIELEALLSGEYDASNAIIEIHPGAGGTEAQDWAQMLLRMYTRWAEDRGYAVELLDLLPGDEAGIKSATLLVTGENAYGYLRSEMGVHRLVRISPFDSSGRRHTSFASVELLPEVDSDDQVEIIPSDLRVDTYRASGAGGQHVNKTDSAVRITHVPTGIVVQCQTERSQHSNRESAMKILRARLLELQMREQQAEIDQLRGDQGEIAWGNQIRSYVFCPYTMVKDHRTNIEVGDVDGVVDGELDPFIEAYLQRQRSQSGKVTGKTIAP